MKKRTIMRIGIPIGLIALMGLSAEAAIAFSNAQSILLGIDFAKLWLNICLILLGVMAVLVLLKFLKKCGLTKAITVLALLALLSATASAAVFFNDRHHDSWFYELDEQLTSKYSSIERVELDLNRKNPMLFIYCDSIDLPSDSDAIVKDIIDILRIGEDNLFKSSYTGRNGDSLDSEPDLDFTVIIYSGDSEAEYTTGYYLGYDHTQEGTIDHYRTWTRYYNGEYVKATRTEWFPTE